MAAKNSYEWAGEIVKKEIDRLKAVSEEQKEIYESQPEVRALRMIDRRGKLNVETGMFEGGTDE